MVLGPIRMFMLTYMYVSDLELFIGFNLGLDFDIVDDILILMFVLVFMLSELKMVF